MYSMRHPASPIYHDIVVATVESKAFYNLSNSYKVYLWDRADLSELSRSMCEYATQFCSQFSAESCVETLWNCLRDNLLFLLDKFVPSKLKRTANRGLLGT